MNEKIHRIMKSKKKKKKKKSACISVHRIGLMLLCGHTPTIYRVNGQGTREEGRKEGTRLRYSFGHFRAPCPPHKTNV